MKMSMEEILTKENSFSQIYNEPFLFLCLTDNTYFCSSEFDDHKDHIYSSCNSLQLKLIDMNNKILKEIDEALTAYDENYNFLLKENNLIDKALTVRADFWQKFSAKFNEFLSKRINENSTKEEKFYELIENNNAEIQKYQSEIQESSERIIEAKDQLEIALKNKHTATLIKIHHNAISKPKRYFIDHNEIIQIKEKLISLSDELNENSDRVQVNLLMNDGYSLNNQFKQLLNQFSFPITNELGTEYEIPGLYLHNPFQTYINVFNFENENISLKKINHLKEIKFLQKAQDNEFELVNEQHKVDNEMLSEQGIIRNDLNQTNYGSSLLLFGNRIFFTGGSTRISDYSNKTFEYSLTNEITYERAELVTARREHSSCAMNGKIFVIGGLGKEGAISSVEKINLNKLIALDQYKWKETNYKLSQAKSLISICSIQKTQRIYCFGGRLDNELTNKIECLDLSPTNKGNYKWEMIKSSDCSEFQPSHSSALIPFKIEEKEDTILEEFLLIGGVISKDVKISENFCSNEIYRISIENSMAKIKKLNEYLPHYDYFSQKTPFVEMKHASGLEKLVCAYICGNKSLYKISIEMEDKIIIEDIKYEKLI